MMTRRLSIPLFLLLAVAAAVGLMRSGNEAPRERAPESGATESPSRAARFNPAPSIEDARVSFDNPRTGFLARFDAGGVKVGPRDEKGWRLGMRVTCIFLSF